MKKLIFPLLMIVAGIQPAYSADAQVFGGVIIGKTTPSELTQLFKSRGCSWRQDQDGQAIVFTPSDGCYQMVATTTQPRFYVADSSVRLIIQDIPKDMHNQNFDTYVSMLKEKYGAPAQYDRPFVGNAMSMWTADPIYVALEFPHMSFTGTLCYGLRSDLEQMYRKEAEANRKSSNDTKSML